MGCWMDVGWMLDGCWMDVGCGGCMLPEAPRFGPMTLRRARLTELHVLSSYRRCRGGMISPSPCLTYPRHESFPLRFPFCGCLCFPAPRNEPASSHCKFAQRPPPWTRRPSPENIRIYLGRTASFIRLVRRVGGA